MIYIYKYMVSCLGTCMKLIIVSGFIFLHE